VPGTGPPATATPTAYVPEEPSLGAWVSQHRRWTVAAVVVVAAGLLAFLDWPHPTTASQARSDFASYATQIRTDVQSCSLELGDALGAYNQIISGSSTDRATALGIAQAAALDCTPMGNSNVEDIGALQSPRSLSKYNLDASTQLFYAWCFPTAVEVANDVQALLGHPGDPVKLKDIATQLTVLQRTAAQAQGSYDAVTQALGMPRIDVGLENIRPGILVG